MRGLFGKYKVILAPMAGITDAVFRGLCIEQGADLAFTEMVSAKGLSYANDKTRHLIDVSPVESKVAVQLFGHEPAIMADEAQWVCQQLGEKLAYIDVNMGCPARKIVKKGDGAALMKDPALASQTISEMKKVAGVPVTAKFRRGYAIGEETAPEFAKAMEDAGADAVTVHGRYAEQLYRGKSSLDCIARVKEAVSVPVVGNGDICSAEDAQAMEERTGCDAVMVARGALGNPWVFKEVKEGAYPATPLQRVRMMARHAEMLERSGLNVKKMRKLAPYYIKGIDGASKARAALSQCCAYDDFERVSRELLSRLEDA